MSTSLFTVSRSSATALLSLIVAGFAPVQSHGADLYWTNSGVITAAPQIDAVNFVNSGIISVSSFAPFETSNTRNFTNSGTMRGLPGFFFLNSPSGSGQRRLADNFFNAASGSIEASDISFIGGVIGGGVTIGSGLFNVEPSYLWIHATNIVNRGLLSVGANGWLKLAGTNVNLTRSGVEVRSIEAVGSFNDDDNGIFTPDVGVDDLYWGQDTVDNPPGINSAGIWRVTPFGAIASSPGHDVTNPGGFESRRAFSVIEPFADTFVSTNGAITVWVTNLVGITNITGDVVQNINLTNLVATQIEIPTNITKQVAFASVSDPSVMLVNFAWYPSSLPTNNFMTVGVEIHTISTNVVSAMPELSSLYLYDTLAAETNRGVLLNATGLINADTYRPSPYVLSRLPSFGGFGSAGMGYPDENFLFQPRVYTNPVVAMDYAGYGAFISYLPSGPPSIPAGTVTNLPGRVQITANTLDMTRTRIRGEGEVRVRANHLVSSTNAIVDSPNMSFFLTSTNRELTFANLVKQSVARLQGNVYAWSGVWENEATFIETNNWAVITNFDESGSNIVSLDATNAPITNGASIGLYALIVSADQLSATLPVTVFEMVTHAANLVVNDPITVVESFYTDAETFTLNGSITFSNATWVSAIGTRFLTSMEDFSFTNAPNLRFFTNNGTFSVPNRIHLGDDTATPYEAVVNNGFLETSTLDIESAYFQNSGTMAIFGPLNVDASDVNLQSGTNFSTFARIDANNVRFNDYSLDALELRLNAQNSLTDAGIESSNRIVVQNGFHIVTRQGSGDLLGTTIETSIPNFIQVDHTWTGQDRGATAAGYANNLALGSLVVGPVGIDPLVYFRGTQPGSAMYVDLLDLNGFTDESFESLIEIDPNLVIYYAAATLGFTPPEIEEGIPQTPEEYLDGKVGGRLRWVSGYAGALSSVEVYVDGSTVFMNAGLRNSFTIDSDNDGTPNYFDPSPLGGEDPPPDPDPEDPVDPGLISLRPSVINPNIGSTTKSFGLTWTAAPNTAYEVEMTTDLSSGQWQSMDSYTNNTSSPQTMTITDPVGSGEQQRFYRIRKK